MKKKNQDIADALWKLEEISEDKKLRRIAQLKEKWERDERSAHEYWKENGLEEGRREGRREGREKGREEGLKQGMEQGKKKAKIEMAKEMLKDGMKIEVVMKYTGLSKKEIENLKEEQS